MTSPIITQVRCVLARGTSGMIEASITRRPSRPSTRQSGPTIARGSARAPIRPVAAGWRGARRAHPAGADRMLGVADDGAHPVVEDLIIGEVIDRGVRAGAGQR